jgi:hypothetical protein
MKITDIEGRFIRLGDRHPEGGRPIETVEGMADAHAVGFSCPVCRGGDAAHEIMIAFEGRLTKQDGLGNTWLVSGTSLDDLTLSPSIQVRSAPCQWHGFVRNGATVDA